MFFFSIPELIPSFARRRLRGHVDSVQYVKLNEDFSGAISPVHRKHGHTLEDVGMIHKHDPKTTDGAFFAGQVNREV